MKYIAFLTIVSAALLSVAHADAQMTQTQASQAPGAPAQSEPAVTVTLSSGGKPGGPTAQAVLSQQGNDVLVTVSLPNASTADANVAIYRGACSAKPSGKALHALGHMSNGALKATLPNTTVAQLAKTPNAIVVDQTPTLCGDISAANPIPGAQESGAPMASPHPHH